MGLEIILVQVTGKGMPNLELANYNTFNFHYEVFVILKYFNV